MDEMFDNVKPMMRMALKGRLLEDYNKVMANNSKYEKCHSKLHHKKIEKMFWRDFKAGAKQINDKVPVFVELPKYEQDTDKSYVVKVGDETKEKVFPNSELPSSPSPSSPKISLERPDLIEYQSENSEEEIK